MVEFPSMFAHIPLSVSERKLWLFTVFCVEYVSDHFTEESRRGWQPLASAIDAVHNGFESRSFETWADYAHQLGIGIIALSRQSADHRESQDAQKLLSGVLSDIVGNPRQPAVIKDEWLTWNGGIVCNIAEMIYRDRAFDRMPILADALEESGCDDLDILQHCRGYDKCDFCSGSGVTPEVTSMLWEPGSPCPQCTPPSNQSPGWIHLKSPHVYGCWVVDLLTGRN